jgi:hypothetical protein
MTNQGELFVFMDESGNGNPDQPLIVGAVVCDRDRSDLEAAIRSRYHQARARAGFQDMDRYEKFVKEGFHRSQDPFDVQANFIDLIISTAGFKIFMVVTDRTTASERSETEQLLALYIWLTNTICRRFRHVGTIHLIIEENESLRPVHPMIISTLNRWLSRSNGSQRPNVTLTESPKQTDSILAIADYAMGVTSAWIRSGGLRDPDKISYRQFRDIEGGISLLYSLEGGVMSSRKLRHV